MLRSKGRTKKIGRFSYLVAVLSMCSMFLGTVSHAQSSYWDDFTYDQSSRFYTEAKEAKGLTALKKGLNTKSQSINYQFVKFGANEMVLRPQAGWYESDDPYFKKLKLRYPVASGCKFYYTNVSFHNTSVLHYKKVSAKSVRSYMKDPMFQIQYETVENGKKCYTSGYFGKVYLKNGEVAAVFTNGGD